MKRIIIVCLIFAMLIACQPTPERDVVVNRREEDLDALIAVTPAPNAVSVRDAVAALPGGQAAVDGYIVGHVYEADPSDGAILLFDADVIVPDTDALPVYAVKKGSWSAADRIAILKAVANGAPIYAPGVYLHASKAYFEAVLDEMKDSTRVAAVDRIYAEDPDSELTWTAQVQEYYRLAPETIELIPFDEAAAGSGDYTAAFYRPDTPDVYVDFYADETRVQLSVFDRHIYDENHVRQGEWPGAEPGRELNNPSLTQAEAEQAAQTFLERIGFTNAALTDVKKAQRSHAFTLANESEGWLLTYRKGIGGIPMLAPAHPEAVRQDDYTAPWPQERVELYVDSEGVWSLNWRNPVQIAKALTESAALMDLDTILRLVRARLSAENADAKERLIDGVRVTRMQLGCCVVPKKDAPDEGYALPVWITDYEVRFTDGRTVPYSFTLNALNGANLHLTADAVSQ